MAVENNLRFTKNFYFKHCLPVIKSNKKHLSKHVATITYTLEKRFFAVAIFSKVFDQFFPDRVKTLAVYSVCTALLQISIDNKTKQILLIRNKFIFLHINSYFDMPKCKIFLKNCSYKNAGCVFSYFCGGYKKFSPTTSLSFNNIF